jgi:6-pyruvoyltetrahydropterin/6-carboxytetrahydropterin synthase
MYKITTVEEVSFAHSVDKDEKCSRIHGHNWKFYIEVESESLVDGMVINFTTIKNLIRELDHKFIIAQRDVMEYNNHHHIEVEKNSEYIRMFDIYDKESIKILPIEFITAEELAKYIYDEIKKIREDVMVRVRVCETEKNCAEFYNIDYTTKLIKTSTKNEVESIREEKMDNNILISEKEEIKDVITTKNSENDDIKNKKVEIKTQEEIDEEELEKLINKEFLENVPTFKMDEKGNIIDDKGNIIVKKDTKSEANISGNNEEDKEININVKIQTNRFYKWFHNHYPNKELDVKMFLEYINSWKKDGRCMFCKRKISSVVSHLKNNEKCLMKLVVT